MNIYDYLFHYNHHTELWYAIPRDRYVEYWNDNEVEGVLKSREISVLTQLIGKGEEFIDSVSK